MVITGGEGSEDLVTEYSGIGLFKGKDSRFRHLYFKIILTNDCQADKKRYLNLEFFPFEGPIPEYSVTRSSLPSPPVITIVEEDN